MYADCGEELCFFYDGGDRSPGSLLLEPVANKQRL